jgi:hypothetical protein
MPPICWRRPGGELAHGAPDSRLVPLIASGLCSEVMKNLSRVAFSSTAGWRIGFTLTPRSNIAAVNVVIKSTEVMLAV